MNKDTALKIVWDYMHLNHELKKADVIFVLGSSETRVAEYAAQLYLDGWAPMLLFAGSGDVHNHKLGREKFIGTTEAELFADIARNMGVPDEAILIENKSQNTGENYEFAIKLLNKNRIKPKTVIAVQKPYMERRTHATGKVWWPDMDFVVTSPPISIEDYPNESNNHNEHWVHSMVGDLQRIKEYPKKGYQIEQEISDEVSEAYTCLVSLGYTDKLIVE